MNRFSSRTSWQLHPNRLTMLRAEKERRGEPVTDLTMSNPTLCGVQYPEEMLRPLASTDSLIYAPSPFGLPAARKAVSGYYQRKGITVDPENVILCGSTSEAYGWLFMLMCNPGDEVLVPTPCYPLFEFIAQLHDVVLRPYRLAYDGQWHIDPDTMRTQIRPRTRAIILVSPHNPTGHCLSADELNAIGALAATADIALIVDEVFSEYRFASQDRDITSTVDGTGALTFTLNGISKLCGLPQLKLGWIVVSGEAGRVGEAHRRLEIIADTFLPVNTPVQVALQEILDSGSDIRAAITARITVNLGTLDTVLSHETPVSRLRCDGGWTAILRLPSTRNDEAWALLLLERSGVLVHPGYFFDMTDHPYVVVSLLADPEHFASACRQIVALVAGET